MTRDQAAVLAVGGLALVCLAAVALLIRALLTLRATEAGTRAELVSLRERLELLDQARRPPATGVTEPTQAVPEFVITDLGSDQGQSRETAQLDRAAFADIVLRETVIKAASLASGVRRALAAPTRNRIRFEMKQEMRRARKQRRAEVKAVRRDVDARRRAALAEEAS